MSKKIAEIGAVIRRFHDSYVSFNKSYAKEPPLEREVDGVKVKFYIVGNNASHCFYLGQNNEDVYRLAVCYDWDEVNNKDATEYNVRKIDINSVGNMYLGHY